MTADHPPIGSVWTHSYPNDSDPSFASTILVLGNSMKHHVVFSLTRVLVIYRNGISKEMLWSTSSFDSVYDLYTLLYSPEERHD
jgi:hypothetical protein